MIFCDDFLQRCDNRDGSLVVFENGTGFLIFSETNCKDFFRTMIDFSTTQFHLQPSHSQDFKINSPHDLNVFLTT